MKTLLVYYSLLLTLLLNRISAVDGCSQFLSEICHCEDLSNGVKLDCSNDDAEKTMNLLKANHENLGLIQELILKNSSIQKIPPKYFMGLYIKKLDLSYNHIDEIGPDSLLGMNNVLQELSIRHNNLTTFPTSALAPLNALHKLDLSNNSIGDLGVRNELPQLPNVSSFQLSVSSTPNSFSIDFSCRSPLDTTPIKSAQKIHKFVSHSTQICVST